MSDRRIAGDTGAFERPREAWADEKIEHWLPEEGLVYVFRWVPDYASAHRDTHPSFDEWLDNLRASAADLDGPTPAMRDWYEMERFGVAGHRPMTADERAEHVEALEVEIRACHRKIDALSASAEADAHG